jgi:hypothetical protein
MQLTQTGLIIGGGIAAPTAKLHVGGNTLIEGNTNIEGTLEVNTGTSNNRVLVKSTATNTDSITLFQNGTLQIQNGTLQTGYVGAYGTTATFAAGKMVIYSETGSNGQLFIDRSLDGFRFNFNNDFDSSTQMFLNPTGLIIGGGANAATAKLQVQGAGATAGTKALLVENSAGTDLLEVKNDGSLLMLGVAGFTGTGAYTNFTITNGIITAAS